MSSNSQFASIYEAWGQEFNQEPSQQSHQPKKKKTHHRKHPKPNQNNFETPTSFFDQKSNQPFEKDLPREVGFELNESTEIQPYQDDNGENNFNVTNYLVNENHSSYSNNGFGIIDPGSPHPFTTEQSSPQQQRSLETDTENDQSDDESGKNESSEKFNDMKLESLERKLDIILHRLQEIDSEPKQENLHDLVLFVIFSLFIVFTMDSIYKIGKQTI